MRIVSLGLVGRGDGDVHRLALEQRCPFENSVILDLLRELGDEIATDLRMSQLATSELDRDLDPIAFLEKLDRSIDLRVEIALADLRPEANLLECHRALPALRLLLSLGQLVLVLTEIEKLDDRRRSHRGYLDEVEATFLRHGEGIRGGHDTQLGSLFIDDSDLWDPDHLVDAQVSTDGSPLRTCSDRNRTPGDACTRLPPRIAAGL